MTDKVTCAERIREGLAIRKMTQADLCRLTGIGKSAMSQYVNGGVVPRQNRTYLIARVLDVSEAWLMGFPVPIERKAPESQEESERKKEFIELFDQLDADLQDAFLAQLRAIVGKAK